MAMALILLPGSGAVLLVYLDGRAIRIERDGTTMPSLPGESVRGDELPGLRVDDAVRAGWGVEPTVPRAGVMPTT